MSSLLRRVSSLRAGHSTPASGVAPYDPQIIMRPDFSTGSIAPFAFDKPERGSVVADPTGLRPGKKFVKLLYTVVGTNAPGTDQNTSSDTAIFSQDASLYTGLGQEMNTCISYFLPSDIFLDPRVARKLGYHRIFYLGVPVNQIVHTVIWGPATPLTTQLYVQGATWTAPGAQVDGHGNHTLGGGQLKLGKFVELKQRIVRESAPGVLDGKCLLFYQSYFVHGYDACDFSEPGTMPDASNKVNDWNFGEQVDANINDQDLSIPEYRLLSEPIMSRKMYWPADTVAVTIEFDLPTGTSPVNVPIRTPVPLWVVAQNANYEILKPTSSIVTSSNPSVASVTWEGDDVHGYMPTLTGHTPGTVTVTATNGAATTSITATINTQPAFVRSLNFRQTQAHATDGAREDWGNNLLYDANRGWGFLHPENERIWDQDTNLAGNPHFAGACLHPYITSKTDVGLKVDLWKGAGAHAIEMAVGCEIAATTPYIEIWDGATLLYTLDGRTVGTVAAGAYMDLHGNHFADMDAWEAGQVPLSLTTTGTQLTFLYCDGALPDSTNFTHLKVYSLS